MCRQRESKGGSSASRCEGIHPATLSISMGKQSLWSNTSNLEAPVRLQSLMSSGVQTTSETMGVNVITCVFFPKDVHHPNCIQIGG